MKHRVLLFIIILMFVACKKDDLSPKVKTDGKDSVKTVLAVNKIEDNLKKLSKNSKVKKRTRRRFIIKFLHKKKIECDLVKK